MVCPPCRNNDHIDCPEVARRIKIRGDKTLAPELRAIQSRNGQVCDCQHGTDS